MFDPLPLSPQPVNIGVQHEEQRIAYGRSNRADWALSRKTGVRVAVRISLHVRKSGVVVAKSQRLYFIDDIGRAIDAKFRSTRNAQLAIRDPLFEGVPRSEHDRRVLQG